MAWGRASPIQLQNVEAVGFRAFRVLRVRGWGLGTVRSAR